MNVENDCSFEYFVVSTKNANEPATSLRLVQTLAAVYCKYPGSCNGNFLSVACFMSVVLQSH